MTGNIFLYYEQGNPVARRSPDVMIVKGLGHREERDSFKVWQEKAVPCAAIELTSKETADEDMGPKKELYERLGVREYFLFDPREEYLPRQLMGYRLVTVAQGNGDNGAEVRQQYDELAPAADGSLPSAELGLRLVPRGEQLDLVDPVTGERLPTPPDAYARMKEYMEQLEEARKAAADARRKAEKAEREAEDVQKALTDQQLRTEQLQHRAERAEKDADQARKEVERAEKDSEQARKDLADERRQRELLEAELARLRSQRLPDSPPATGDRP